MSYTKSFLLLLVLLCLGNLALAQDEISPERKRAIDSLAIEKVRDLSKYITIIGDRSTPFSEANRVIDRAVELFTPDAEIGVSSLNREEIQYFGARRYFERLMALNYDQVKISWYDIQYISDLELQPDGTYVGVITIYQRFEGTNDNGLNYKDTTKKDITVYVKRKSTQIGGRLIEPLEGREDTLSLLDNAQPGLGDTDAAFAPLKKRYTELVFQLLNSNTERRLTNMATLSSPAKMPFACQRNDVS